MGFSSDLWVRLPATADRANGPASADAAVKDSFEAIYTRVREGKVFTTKVEDFFKKRAEIEKEYAKKLQTLVKGQEVERGYRILASTRMLPSLTSSRSVNQAWTTIKNETENLAKRHAVPLGRTPYPGLSVDRLAGDRRQPTEPGQRPSAQLAQGEREASQEGEIVCFDRVPPLTSRSSATPRASSSRS